MSLRGKQKRFLRSKSPSFTNQSFKIGKGGINSAMMVQIAEANLKKES